MKQTKLFGAPSVSIKSSTGQVKFAPLFRLVGTESYRRTQRLSEGIALRYPSDRIYEYLQTPQDKASIRSLHWAHAGAELSPSLLAHCLSELTELGLIEEVGVIGSVGVTLTTNCRQTGVDRSCKMVVGFKGRADCGMSYGGVVAELLDS
jgi:hypothetical protein